MCVFRTKVAYFSMRCCQGLPCAQAGSPVCRRPAPRGCPASAAYLLLLHFQRRHCQALHFAFLGIRQLLGACGCTGKTHRRSAVGPEEAQGMVKSDTPAMLHGCAAASAAAAHPGAAPFAA